jgi:hypothetical protein
VESSGGLKMALRLEDLHRQRSVTSTLAEPGP